MYPCIWLKSNSRSRVRYLYEKADGTTNPCFVSKEQDDGGDAGVEDCRGRGMEDHIMVPQLCAHPNPHNLWLCYCTHKCWTWWMWLDYDSKMGQLSWIIQVGPHNHKGGREVTLGERDVTTEAEVTVRKNNLKMLPLALRWSEGATS